MKLRESVRGEPRHFVYGISLPGRQTGVTLKQGARERESRNLKLEQEEIERSL